MKVLSLFVCLVMMLSGGYLQEDPRSAASTQVTIRDVVVNIQGEEYPLNPTLTFGASTEGTSALLDVFMTLNDNTLFPVQAKFDESGMGVLLGNSNTAYTFTAELFDEMMGGEEIPDDVFTALDTGFALIRKSLNMMDSDEIDIQAINYASYEKLSELSSNYLCEATTFTIDDTEHTGKRATFELNNEQFKEWTDYTYSLYPAEYSEVLSQFLALGDSMAESTGTPTVETTISGEISYNETVSLSFLSYHNEYAFDTEGLSEEEIAAMEEVYPAYDMHITSTTASADRYSSDIFTEIGSMTMNASVSTDEDDMACTITMSEPDVMDVFVDLLASPDENGVIQAVTASLGVIVDDTHFSLITETTFDEADSSSIVNLIYNEGEVFNAEVIFHADVTHNAITDRISSASVQTISSTEELEGTAANFSFAAMSMMSDVEKLLNDESVAAFADIVETLLGTAEMEADVESDGESEYIEPTCAEPTFGWMPEGYSMTDNYYDGNYGCYSFTFAPENDTYGEYTLYVDVYGPSDEDYGAYTYYTISDGEASLVNSDVLSASSTVMDDFTFHTLWGYSGDCYLSLTSYDPEMTLDDLAKFASNIIISE